MGESAGYYYGHYSPVGDILVMAICVVFLILMHSAYISRSDAYLRFRKIVIYLLVLSVTSLCFRCSLMNADFLPPYIIYVLLAGYHVLFYAELLLYLQYMEVPLRLNRSAGKRAYIPTYIVFALCTLYEIISPFFGWGLRVDEKGRVYEGLNVAPFYYLVVCGMILYLLIRYRKRVYRQVIFGVICSCLVAFVLLFIQMLYNQTSYTVASFLFPTFTVLYMIHSNPYDLEMGAVDSFAFEDLIRYAHEHEKELLLMSLYLPEMDEEGKQYSEAIKDRVRNYSEDYFKGSTLFQITNGHLVLVVDLARNPKHEQVVNRMLNHFEQEYPKYGLAFKIVITKTMERVGQEGDYVNLIRYVESKMALNSVHFVENEDVDELLKHKYILKELQDICKKKDMDDPRVEVFCQPVLNIETKRYDTAEALMRINLKEVGRVFPDVFIPMAEEHGLIHQLSLIILHKTCDRIRSMLEEGYYIQRISVNISAMELRDDNFCGDISRVIAGSGIPFGKVAIELTESQSERDFMIMKSKINELKENGIKFYLDDFGTGYSNFERIMELPFDIIKFDRSLVLATAVDPKSEQMVSHLAKMFSDMNYSVLYEGVETPKDEENCVRMNAKYLQGYKYSRPIPIEELPRYFEKSVG